MPRPKRDKRAERARAEDALEQWLLDGRDLALRPHERAALKRIGMR